MASPHPTPPRRREKSWEEFSLWVHSYDLLLARIPNEGERTWEAFARWMHSYDRLVNPR
jgi:hypothetical protein